MENANSPEYLEKIKNAVIENLKKTVPAPPSVQMQDVPRQGLGQSDEDEAELDDEDEDQNKDSRWTERRLDKHTIRDDEFEESGDEEMAEANGVFRPKGGRKRITDHKNPYAQPDYEEVVANGHDAEAAQAQAGEETDNHDADETMEDIGAEPQQAPEAEVPVEAESVPPVPEATAETDKDGDVDMTEAADVPAPAIKQEDADLQPPAPDAVPPPVVEEEEKSDKPDQDTADSNPAAEVVENSEKKTDETDGPAPTVVEPSPPEETEPDKATSPAKSPAPADSKPAAEDAEPSPKANDSEPKPAETSVDPVKED